MTNFGPSASANVVEAAYSTPDNFVCQYIFATNGASICNDQFLVKKWTNFAVRGLKLLSERIVFDVVFG